jgi:hypothetical protein
MLNQGLNALSQGETRLPARPLEQSRDWDKFFGSLGANELDGIALLRVIECTNGCIQHASREKIPQALSIDETRQAMQFSMGLMKVTEFDVGQSHYSFSDVAVTGIREIRELYKKAFKTHDNETEAALEEFMNASVACVSALGLQRIVTAANLVKEHLSNVFPSHTVDWGVRYLRGLMPQSSDNT